MFLLAFGGTGLLTGCSRLRVESREWRGEIEDVCLFKDVIMTNVNTRLIVKCLLY